MLWLTVSATVGLLAFAIYAFIQASRFDKIRELLENAGPQNLADLQSASLDNTQAPQPLNFP